MRAARSGDESVHAGIRQRAIVALATDCLGEHDANAWANDVSQDRFTHAVQVHRTWIGSLRGRSLGWVEVHEHRIMSLYVEPRRARCGIGSTLLAHAEVAIRGAGFTDASLEASRNAGEFYASHGYVRVGPADSTGALPHAKRLVSP